MKEKDFRSVGDKIACLTTRDIGLLNPGLVKSESDYEYTFPVDTWGQKIHKKLDEHTRNKNSPKDTKKFFIKKCIEFDVDPLKFAAELGHLGSKSLEIALKYLKKTEL